MQHSHPPTTFSVEVGGIRRGQYQLEVASIEGEFLFQTYDRNATSSTVHSGAPYGTDSSR